MILNSGCAKPEVVTVINTEFVYMVPEKIPRPSKPTFEYLSAEHSLDEIKQFITLQRNFVKLKNYANSLVDVLMHYENIIDEYIKARDSPTEEPTAVDGL